MRAYLQLLRLPNVFTAMADIFLGYLFTHDSLQPAGEFVLLLAASSLLYLAGMVLNDYFDQEQDALERPFRPIPSGRVRAVTALQLGVSMLAMGAALAAMASWLAGDPRPIGVAVLLAAAIVLYDAVLKKTPLGPVAMGSCRLLNVLLGMSTAAQAWPPVDWVVAGGVGAYIAGVTVFARSEARHSGRPQLSLGLVILLAGVALLASLPSWANGSEVPPLDMPSQWLIYWGLFVVLIGWRCLRAIVAPTPAMVQGAVRNCIFSLVILDAAACLAVQDYYWGLVILLLLVPTMTLGRWIYAT